MKTLHRTTLQAAVLLVLFGTYESVANVQVELRSSWPSAPALLESMYVSLLFVQRVMYSEMAQRNYCVRRTGCILSAHTDPHKSRDTPRSATQYPRGTVRICSRNSYFGWLTLRAWRICVS